MSDFEDRLRQSLQARAHDVTPDPTMFARVQSRVRRGRNFRFALVGATATLVLAGTAIAAPRLIQNEARFQDPPAVATAPAGGTATAAPAREAAAEAPTTSPPPGPP